ncbi:MAG TPA: hypothetical protein VFE62_25905 [Gemmataceae bacterium]|nr:hypothetical protein [Gemmataceae bacterium]
MLNRMIAGLAASLFVAGLSFAQPDPMIEKAVNDVAGEFKAGKETDARKKAVAAAKKIAEPAELMRLFGPPKKMGLGLGAKLMNLPKAKAAEDLGNTTAAMAELTRAMAPKKKTQAWIAEADALRKAGLDLAKAAAKNDAKGMRAAADKANAACVNCHSQFK